MSVLIPLPWLWISLENLTDNDAQHESEIRDLLLGVSMFGN
jgi:hypothetical protein